MQRIHQCDLSVSRFGLSLASVVTWDNEPICKADVARACDLVLAACEQGITLFDHGDVYGFGKVEAVFGRVLKEQPGLRDKIVIQSKCGQCVSKEGFSGPIRVNLNREHIRSAVEGSLRRLEIDHLDTLLLHAPDALMRPEEVAQAFDELHSAGKVRYFGVSNHDACQIALLKSWVRQPLIVNQIQIGLADVGVLAEGMEFTLSMLARTWGQGKRPAAARTGTIDYCRLNDIQVQAWAPVRGIARALNEECPQLKAVVQLLGTIARRKDTTCIAVALAWLLAHPSGIVPILGTSSPTHLIEDCGAERISLSSEEWYDLFAAAASV